MIVRNASGSTRSPSAVEPVTSQNRTVTTLRCSAATWSTAPHSLQNFDASGFSAPQRAQTATTERLERGGDSHNSPLVRVPHPREAGALVERNATHVIRAVRDVRIRLESGRAVGER